MTKQIMFFVMALILLIPLSAFAQESLTCPSGAYHGLDNAGNNACRDIKTNKIVQGVTTQNDQIKPSQQTDPCVNPLAPECVSLPSFSFGKNALWIFGAIGIIFVTILVIVTRKGKKPTEIPVKDTSTDWSRYVEPDTKERMMWTCSMCKQKFSDKHSYLNHGCHFK